MTAGDCYELGKVLYNEKDYANALAWMTEAMRKYKEENQPYLFKEIDIMEYIGFSHYLLGNNNCRHVFEFFILKLEQDLYKHGTSNIEFQTRDQLR